MPTMDDYAAYRQRTAAQERIPKGQWKPTYDTFATREAAAKDLDRRRSLNARAGNTRVFAIKRKGDRWTVMYKEKG